MGARDDAEAIFRAAVARVDPEPMMERSLRVESRTGGAFLVIDTGSEEHSCNLDAFDRIFAVGFGKASARMAAGLEAVLGARLAGGFVATGEGQAAGLERLHILEAGHPIPDARSEAAAAAILGLGPSLGGVLSGRDLVIVLVSGGGSAMLCAPAEGLSLADKAAATSLLLASGAAISEVNCLRKHLSAVKGGRLAAALAPATVIALVLSDVVGDELDAIASGPTVPDPTSFADAIGIARRYGIAETLPSAVLAHLEAGAAGLIPDTPKPGDPAFARTRTILLGTNRLALAAAEAEARRLGYNSLVLSSRVTGEAREIALVYLGIGKDIAASDFPLAKPACLISGGETTVSLRGKGRGGRNQEMVLAFLTALGRAPHGGEGLCFLSAGTDGRDGPTDAAGACCGLETYRAALAAGLDPAAFLADNDSYGFFGKVGGLITTGPTGTNVCDVQVLVVP